MKELTDKQKKLISKIDDLYISSRDSKYRKYKQEAWKICQDSWRSKITKPIPRRSNLFIPITFQTVETMVSRTLSSIFNENTGLFKFIAREKKDEGQAEAVTAFANYDFTTIPSIHRKFRTFLTRMYVQGLGIFRIYWDYKDSKTVNKQGEERTNTYRDRFNIDNISPENFYIDPDAKTLPDAKWVILKSMMDKDTFKAKMRQNDFIKMSNDDVDRLETSSGLGNDGEWIERDLEDFVTADRTFIEITEYFSVPENKYIIIAGSDKIIKDEEMPYPFPGYPFLVGMDIPDPEEFYPLSTTEIIYDLQAELNAFRNNRMDKANFLMNPMYKVKNGAALERKELRSRPGGMVRVKDMDDIQPLFKGNMEQSDYQEEVACKSDMQATSGISDYSMGVSGGGANSTATGISIISSNADSRIITKVQDLTESVLNPLGYMWLHMQREFCSEEQFFVITGKPYQFIKTNLNPDYLLQVLSSTMMLNKQVRQNQVMQLSQLTAQSPNVNHEEWLRIVFETFGFPTAKLIQPTPPLPPPPPPSGSLQGAQQPDPNAGNTQPTGLGNQSGYDFATGKPV